MIRNLFSARSPSTFAAAIGAHVFTLSAASAQQAALEEVVVTAEKRSESLQDLSQAVTAFSDRELDTKNLLSFVDLAGVAPGVNITKNEGFKTVIVIRGLGNEANQNAVANPSVSYHLDGVYVASPFAVQTDFIDVERIEVMRGPQGTLFGQNSTGGAINVISKKASTEDLSGSADITVGEFNLVRARGSVNIPISDKVATRISLASLEQDGFSRNLQSGQELDQADNISARMDWQFDLSEQSSLRLFGQYFQEDSNGAAIKGIFDPETNPRRLNQDTLARYDLESQIYGAIFEWDAGAASVKTLASWQKDDITVIRDNDRHSFATNPEITISEFDPEINVQETKTFEVNVISNEPLWGSVDWIIGAFYLDTDIDITIREELDTNGNGVLDGFPMSFPEVFGGDVGFISDSKPTRESLSLYGQTTWSINESARLVTGLRWTDDEVESSVTNFFAPEPTLLETSVEEVTGKIALEYDITDAAMTYVSYTRGFKPGGSNLTFGPGGDGFEALVDPIYEDESIDAYEVGVKADFLAGRLRTNIAAFYYEYENMQFQATDPVPFQGGVANIPEAEVSGLELELLAILGTGWTLDAKIATLDSEITSSFEALDNVLAQPFFFGDEVIRFSLRQDVAGNELPKAPELTADITLRYETTMANGSQAAASVQYTHRGDFTQRIFENPDVDLVDSYDLVNLVLSYDTQDATWGLDLMAMNLADEDGVNSRMTDVFGVSATGVELIPPRQVMARVRYNF